MHEARTDLHLAADPRRVWEALSDVASWPDWLDTVTALELLEDGPVRVGSRARVRQPGFPAAVWTVTELVEGRLFTWESPAPGLHSTGRHEVVPEDDGARVTLSIAWRGPLTPVARLLWGRRTQDYVTREGRCLAARVGAPV